MKEGESEGVEGDSRKGEGERFSVSQFKGNKIGLCSDSTSYYRVFGPCLSSIPCEEKTLFQFWCILTVFHPIRRGFASPPIRIAGVGLGCSKPSHT